MQKAQHEQCDILQIAQQIGGMDVSMITRLKELERENKELRRANDILKTASAFFAQAELDRRLKS